VARLLWRVFEETWPGAKLVTLLDPRADVEIPKPGIGPRASFATRMAVHQLGGRCAWTLYSHLGLAQVQRVLPAGCERPYAVFLHDIEGWGPMAPARYRVLKRAALRLANSGYTARRVAAAHPDVGPVVECPLALPPEDTRGEAAAPIDLDCGPRDVLAVGRMAVDERYKGHDQLLEAWPSVAARVPDARLVFVGQGDDVERLAGKASALGIAASVRFTGFVPRDMLRGLYARAALMALPSRREGFGLVYLEAMAQGLPCIGSVHDAAGDVIRDGVTGYLVDQADTALLASRIVELLTDDDRRGRMGAAGRQRFHECFTYEQFAARIVPLLQASLEPGERVLGRAASQAS
jgi:phosphatidyl-myo-inositol dimannoside synthase